MSTPEQPSSDDLTKPGVSEAAGALSVAPASAQRRGANDGEPAAIAPRLVIRGESSQDFPTQTSQGHDKAALTDWLNVTFPFFPDPETVGEFFRQFSESTGGILGGMTDRGRGLHGWNHSFAFDRGNALFAYSGQRNTAFLSLPGQACSFLSDWPRLIEFLRDRLRGRITRWDGAVDDFKGKHSVDLAVELYLRDGFKTGGKRPSCGQQGNWIQPDGTGRTFYVGKRQNGKLLRVYEKGMQLGSPFDPWVRWEIEYHNVDRAIPWDVLLYPGRYVAGAFPCMAWVHEQASRIRTVKAQDEISYDRLMKVGSLTYGPLINVMLQREGSAERVVEKLRRSGVPRRLVFTDDFLRYRKDTDSV